MWYGASFFMVVGIVSSWMILFGPFQIATLVCSSCHYGDIMRYIMIYRSFGLLTLGCGKHTRTNNQLCKTVRL